MRKAFRFVGAASAAMLGASLCGAAVAAPSDYPTDAVVDYAVGCLVANGASRETLQACSCSVDVVASLLPYDRYVTASTFLSMMQATGEAGELFRSTAESKASIQDLRRAQAEADVLCFKGG